MSANEGNRQELTPGSLSFPPGWNYEAAVAEVEAMIADIEAGELDLAAVFDQFAAAVEQLRYCEAFLVERQQQMDLLIENLEEDSTF